MFLEKKDMDTLKSGRSLVIETASGSVELRFETPAAEQPVKIFKCDVCGEYKNTVGKPFRSLNGLERHKKKAHGNGSNTGTTHPMPIADALTASEV